jgi:hypothetical protein
MHPDGVGGKCSTPGHMLASERSRHPRSDLPLPMNFHGQRGAGRARNNVDYTSAKPLPCRATSTPVTFLDGKPGQFTCYGIWFKTLQAWTSTEATKYVWQTRRSVATFRWHYITLFFLHVCTNIQMDNLIKKSNTTTARTHYYFQIQGTTDVRIYWVQVRRIDTFKI